MSEPTIESLRAEVAYLEAQRDLWRAKVDAFREEVARILDVPLELIQPPNPKEEHGQELV